MTGRCAETCMTEGECTCHPDAANDELRRVDAQAQARRREAILTETTGWPEGIGGEPLMGEPK
ncbi:hypothetical protein FBZ85_11661 [Azospirillum brasilense]|uniref:Uncharacterized protein n=1 Tax=Azospirillum baldaniorum TaxID=1064539 RepID=A0A9P1JTA3_9PROT|nr:hypothetical protein [Azospirillum baldaniorum]TWA73369.1 hypothetical protein FBZ85_11661 [Azospirillum brasilense]CCC99368.1 conserved protein of unknown function [Azospirillum baldaniorum]